MQTRNMSETLSGNNGSNALYSGVGVIAIVYVTFKLALTLTRGLLAYFLGPTLRMNATDLMKAGSWAGNSTSFDSVFHTHNHYHVFQSILV